MALLTPTVQILLFLQTNYGTRIDLMLFSHGFVVPDKGSNSRDNMTELLGAGIQVRSVCYFKMLFLSELPYN